MRLETAWGHVRKAIREAEEQLLRHMYRWVTSPFAHSGPRRPEIGKDRGDAAAKQPLLRQAEFGEDRVHVLLDRRLGQVKASRDRRVRLALCHLPQHLDLALAEQPQRRLGPARPEVDKALDDT